MPIRKKIFIVFSIIIVLLFIGISNIFSKILEDDFSELEKREVRQNMIRGTNAYQNIISSLAHRIMDWAQWDETYNYVKGENNNFIENNLNKDIFSGLGVNIIVITDKNNNIIYKQIYNNEGREISFFQGLEKYFLPTSEFLNFEIDTQHKHAGTFIIPEGIVIMANTQVLPTSGNGEPLGSLTFGIIFDESSLIPLSELTQLELSYSLYDNIKESDFQNAKQFLSSKNSTYIADAGKNSKISAYSLIENTNKEPALILKIEMNRDIYQNGQKNISFFIVIIFITSLVFLITILILIEFLVIRRLLQLNQQIEKISLSKKADDRLVIFGNDEFAQLSKKINKMLDDLHASDIKKKELEDHKEKLDKAVMGQNREISLKLLELKKVNDVMVNRELKMIELKEKIRALEEEINKRK